MSDFIRVFSAVFCYILQQCEKEVIKYHSSVLDHC